MAVAGTAAITLVSQRSTQCNDVSWCEMSCSASDAVASGGDPDAEGDDRGTTLSVSLALPSPLLAPVSLLSPALGSWAADLVPFVAVAEAAYALVYAHNELGLIPNHINHVGRADDSAVVRAVLIENERVLSEYAERHDLEWSLVTVKP